MRIRQESLENGFIRTTIEWPIDPSWKDFTLADMLACWEWVKAHPVEGLPDARDIAGA